MFQKPQQPSNQSSASNAITKILAIKEDLRLFPFRSKFYELTQSNVFNFDVYKVINDKNHGTVARLCQSFFYFLVLKVMMRIYEENFNVPVMGGTRDSFGEGRKVNAVRANSIENQICEMTFRINKNRASTTVESSKTFSSQDSQLKASEYETMTTMLIKASQDLTQSYFQLTESFKNKHRVQKIEIVCFLIALISPEILHSIVQSAEREVISKIKRYNARKSSTENDQKDEDEDGSCIEQEVYIILTYQTLGAFVSANVFKCLRKKYVKQTIFNVEGDQGYYKLVKSLKHVKERLTQKDVIIIKGRRQRALDLQKLKRKGSLKIENEDCFSLQKMKLFIKDSLKTKQDIDFNLVHNADKKQQDELDQLNHKIQQSFYPSFKKQKTNPKIAISKESPIGKYSTSIKTKLNMQNYRSRKSEELKKKKYISNSQKTFYKFKSNQTENEKMKIGTIKSIKSERSSYKFSKINLEACKENSTINLQSKKSKEPIEHMKFKLKLFKEEALKDLEAIQQFKPLKCSSNRREISYAQERVTKNSFFRQERHAKVASSKQLLTQGKETSKQKYYTLKLPHNEKQQLWHEMYNIKNETAFSSKLTTAPQFSYKLSKNSDKLRKDKQSFLSHCKNRADFLEEDIDLVQRLRMKMR